MKTQIDQNGISPGSTMFVRATLIEYGVPVDHRALVRAEFTRPDGSAHCCHSPNIGRGVRGSADRHRGRRLPVPYPGEGSTLRGQPFTREDLSTGAITSSDIVDRSGSAQ